MQRAELSFLQSTEKGLERLLLSLEVWMAAYIYTRQTLGRSLQTSCKVSHRKIQRQFLSKAMEVSLDKQGRILVPALHREMADLEKDVIFVGMMNRVELWDKARYNTEETEEDEELLASAMDTLDISL
jgi:division/cell wall cluster transcriptional repressor MraZ